MQDATAAGTRLPAEGTAPDDLWALMDEARAGDVDWRGGRVAGYLFLGGEDVLAVAKRAYTEFSSENGLSAKAFPSLQRFESDVIAMTAGLFHGEQAVGSITGGGTRASCWPSSRPATGPASSDRRSPPRRSCCRSQGIRRLTRPVTTSG
jgi:glutamate/tyrosine decarboxylase-like PLP-dependent enzyme